MQTVFSQRLRVSYRKRAGLSRLDVVLLIGMIGFWIWMIAPPMQRAGRGRRMECQNNLKNIALAVTSYATVHQGRLPPLEDGRFGWPVALLPHLDAAALHRALMTDPSVVSKAREKVAVAKIFVCPQDILKAKLRDGLSYVANAGWGRFRVSDTTEEVFENQPHSADVDWDGDGTVTKDERQLTYATGVFWRPREDRFQLTFDDVAEGDGQAMTMLFTENTNARNWLSRETLDIGFVVDLERMKFESSADGRLGLNVKSANLGPFAIQPKPRGLPGRSPVPSSHHTGIFNVAFVDGRVQWVNVNIDPRVYLAQMTWNGVRHGEDPKLPLQ